MTGFRGSDESLDREIEAIERIARVRVRRVASELHDLEKELRVLKRERARRRAMESEHLSSESPVTVEH